MIDLATLTQVIETRFNAQAALGVEASFQFLLSEGQAFFVKIAQEECQLTTGVDAAADIEFSMSEEVLSAIVNGELNPMQAFMEGQIVAQGDMMLAPVLAQVFMVQ